MKVVKTRGHSVDSDELLSRHDVPCPACGHSLKGLKIDVCPECGQAFDRPALGFVSADLGLESLTQTWLAYGVLLAANVGLALELRHVGFAAAAADASVAAGCVLRTVCTGAFVLVSLPVVHELMGDPDVEHRATTPDRWVADMLGAWLANVNLPAVNTWFWRAAWAATGLNAVVYVLQRVL